MRYFLLLTLTVGSISAALAQSTAYTSTPSPAVFEPVTASVALATPPPNDPADILSLAEKMNGLEVPSARPWHVKFTWEQFDEDGDNVHRGTLEEFYADAKKYRLIYTGDTLNQTEIATASGLYRSGDQRWPDATELQIGNEAIRPFHLALKGVPDTRLDRIDYSVGASKMACVIFRWPAGRVIADDWASERKICRSERRACNSGRSFRRAKGAAETCGRSYAQVQVPPVLGYGSTSGGREHDEF